MTNIFSKIYWLIDFNGISTRLDVVLELYVYIYIFV